MLSFNCQMMLGGVWYGRLKRIASVSGPMWKRWHLTTTASTATVPFGLPPISGGSHHCRSSAKLGKAGFDQAFGVQRNKA